MDYEARVSEMFGKLFPDGNMRPSGDIVRFFETILEHEGLDRLVGLLREMDRERIDEQEPLELPEEFGDAYARIADVVH